MKIARKSKRISTVSTHSKSNISTIYHTNNQSIDVIYSAYRSDFKSLENSQIQSVRNKFSEGKPYFMFLSSPQPRKNLLNLLKAFEQNRSLHKSEVKLLIAGTNQWVKKDLMNFYKSMRFKKEVIFTGRIEYAELLRILP